MTVDLSRFVEGHERQFADALRETEAGRKQTHWIWFVFPQITDLGRSETARHYGISSVDEARAFLDHPVLGANYRRIVSAVHRQVVERGIAVHELLGSPDDLKLVSSLTLFRGVTDDDALHGRASDILTAAASEGLPECAATVVFLGGHPAP